jgi:hypothetical protein
MPHGAPSKTVITVETFDVCGDHCRMTETVSASVKYPDRREKRYYGC